MAADSASDCMALGYTALKFDPAGPSTIRAGHMPAMSDIALSAAFCAAVREAVGDRADLLFGTHGQFSTGGAIRIRQAIAPYSPLWFEEPMPPDQLPEIARAASGVPIPVATGERLTTWVEFAAALRHGAGIVQLALGRAGGLWEGRKIAALAESWNTQVAPHLYAGPVEWAANIQLCATIPNCLMAETIEASFDGADQQRPAGRGRLCPRPRGPGPRHRGGRGACPRPIPIPARACTCRCRKPRSAITRPNVFEGGAPPVTG